ncbi:hypothetical protein COCVIDRAFT_103149 [Bipolaris victoriae FI3]|uniref:Transcription initiation factor TFIID subunit 4 n=2 Tax=Bipolaris TaxID=33194 RepID=W6YUH6_COCC2|nr:uncharacterized protein COCCADRAFT_21549 [Bipolaris zeicola 26-R-13]XP_014555173.1 hypothetical protein COCVIDRAFT_103149 [Bipolaris victoriae FI3]EUC39119.1 hypothetical protein COCCADRAFT_21549 [Bipolaris zeicola 26-R-13]
MSYNQQYPPPQGQQQQPRAFSPQNYQHSPTALSPTMGSGIPPNKRQRLSPNPPSPAPYQSPFGMPGAPAYPSSPYANSPQTPGYLSLPTSPAAMQPPPFHQPQPYQQPNAHSPAPQSSMPPPKVPYSKATDNSELEKANARDLDVNNISDVLTGSGIDLRAEEDNLLQNYRSFTSQGSASTVSPHGSFNNWNQQGHGAYQGTGPLSQEMTKEQQQAEFIRKHEQAARILNESAQHPLNDPFLSASVLRHRIAKRGYEHGIQINVDGLFDKIPDKGQQEITRSTQTGANGEQIIGLEAASLLNQNAPLVEILTLITLAAEERVRTLVEDSFALCQGRQNTSDGVIPPQMVDIAVIDENAQEKMVRPVNILKTPWEAPDSAVSPTATANKGLPNAARLPTPPSEAPPTPQRTFQNINRVANALTKRVQDDYKWEQERLRKRAKRQAGVSSTSADAPAIPIPLPEPVTKKALAAAKKQSQSDVVVFGKANETASMALGGKKKKYSWMTGGGGGGGGGGGSASGASTPRPVAASGGSGTVTPAAQAPEKALIGRKRKFGEAIEQTETGAGIQLRDLIHVLENDGREKKTLTLILARMKNTDKDVKTEVNRNLPPISTNVPGRV